MDPANKVLAVIAIIALVFDRLMALLDYLRRRRADKDKPKAVAGDEPTNVDVEQRKDESRQTESDLKNPRVPAARRSTRRRWI